MKEGRFELVVSSATKGIRLHRSFQPPKESEAYFQNKLQNVIQNIKDNLSPNLVKSEVGKDELQPQKKIEDETKKENLLKKDLQPQVSNLSEIQSKIPSFSPQSPSKRSSDLYLKHLQSARKSSKQPKEDLFHNLEVIDILDNSSSCEEKKSRSSKILKTFEKKKLTPSSTTSLKPLNISKSRQLEIMSSAWMKNKNHPKPKTEKKATQTSPPPRFPIATSNFFIFRQKTQPSPGILFRKNEKIGDPRADFRKIEPKPAKKRIVLSNEMIVALSKIFKISPKDVMEVTEYVTGGISEIRKTLIRKNIYNLL